MRYIFREILIKAWTGANFAITKYTMLNRIIAKHCMNFYMECWTDRNLKLHDKDKQRRRIKEWYVNKREKAL